MQRPSRVKARQARIPEHSCQKRSLAPAMQDRHSAGSLSERLRPQPVGPLGRLNPQAWKVTVAVRP